MVHLARQELSTLDQNLRALGLLPPVEQELRSFNKARSNKAITANKVRFTKVKKERVTVKNASKPACGKYTKDGSVVCKAVNDKRSCTGLAGKCPKGQYHGCDILLLSTKACCGSKTHTRTQHKEDLHGKWVPFSAPKK